ncbi:MAG TPA: glycoside hydrolase family 16 protein [Acidimicrobiales bacterium]|nr:glycoside hydrolase family 16 protein [Acidimicrobiales bacterium]
MQSRRRRPAALATAGFLFMVGTTTVFGFPLAGSTAAAGAATGSSTCAGATPPVAAPTGPWTCTFDDEFNASSLDTTKWQAMTTAGSGYRTGPFGSYVCYVNDPRTIAEAGGYLNLSVVSNGKSVGCHNFSTKYLGGMVYSSGLFDQEFGYFEVRAAMPAQTTPGVQETLWLFPEDQKLYGRWPDSGEIDFGEFYSEYPNNDIPIVHYPGSKNDPNATNNYCTQTGVTTAGQFNTYAVMWTPSTITAYFNGVPCFTDNYWHYVKWPDKAPEPFTQPFFLNLTQALGNGSGNTFKASTTSLPATTKVDWVRVWQYS